MDSVRLSWGGSLPNWAARYKSSVLLANLPYVVGAGVLSRILIYFVAFLYDAAFDKGRRIRELMCSWDCGWYLSIIEHGYMSEPERASSKAMPQIGGSFRFIRCCRDLSRSSPDCLR